MPIASITKEEKLEVLLQDTRDFCTRNKEQYDNHFTSFDSVIEYHDVVTFLDTIPDIPASAIVESLAGKDAVKIDRLLVQAQSVLEANSLKERWLTTYEEWHDPDEHSSKWAPGSLSTRHWEY